MYSKQEASELRQAFWAAFGQYMVPILSAEGEKINWVNYKTGEKGISFRMDADNHRAAISVELTHKDPGIQQLYYEQFTELRKIMEETIGEEWTWQLHTYDHTGKVVSRIFTEVTGVNIFRRDDWPSLISFFKPRIIALDHFWSTVKYGFEALR
jgi:hypothetical protein